MNCKTQTQTHSIYRHLAPTRLIALCLPAFCALVLSTSAVTTPVFAQDKAADDDVSAMGVRHQRVERMMLDLERKFTTLAEKLQKTEPERAQRLVAALQKAKELLIQKRLGEITVLLNDSRFDVALDEQEEILASLKELIKLLLNEQIDEDRKAKEERDALERMKQEIQNMLKEERREESESRKLANKEGTLKDLDAQIAAVKDLIDKQNKVNKETDENKDRGIQALDRVANKQHGVRKETEKVAEAIGKQSEIKGVDDVPLESSGDPQEDPEAEGPDGEGKDSEAKDSEGKDSEGKFGDGKPKESEGEPKDGKGKPGEGEPKDGKPADGKPGEGKPGEGKPGEGKPGEGKPGEGKPGEAKPGEGEPKEGQPQEGQPQQPRDETRPPQAGEKPLKAAAENQKKAEDNLARGKSAEAQRDEKKATDDLKKALAELEKEKRRVASLPPEAFDKLAKNQKKIEEKAKKLQEDMKQAAEKKAAENKDGSPSPTPGQQQMQEAQQAMKNASKNFEQQDAQAANRQQKEAIKKMKEALREIEDRLKQLRDETQEEKLARLEARFTEMLAKQQLASALTLELNEKRISGGDRLRRGDLLQLAKLTASERELAGLAQEAYEILVEDGTSVVFPEIVMDLREDLLETGDLLEGRRTDELTQALQSEIEMTLEELLDALKKEQRQRAGGGGGGGGGNPPLLPKSAELKMLRSAQLRVNRRTKKFDEIRGDDKLDEALDREVQNIADRQLKIVDLTEQVLQNTN